MSHLLWEVIKILGGLKDETVDLIMQKEAAAAAAAEATAEVAEPEAAPADAEAIPETADATAGKAPPPPVVTRVDPAQLIQPQGTTTIAQRLNTIKNIMAVLVEHLDDDKLTGSITELGEKIDGYSQSLTTFEETIEKDYADSIKSAKVELDNSQSEIETHVSGLNSQLLEEHGKLDTVRDELLNQIRSLNASLGDLTTYDTKEISEAANKIGDPTIKRGVLDSLRNGGRISKRRNRKKYSRRL